MWWEIPCSDSMHFDAFYAFKISCVISHLIQSCLRNANFYRKSFIKSFYVMKEIDSLCICLLEGFEYILYTTASTLIFFNMLHNAYKFDIIVLYSS